jgi:hypothetical protein
VKYLFLLFVGGSVKRHYLTSLHATLIKNTTLAEITLFLNYEEYVLFQVLIAICCGNDAKPMNRSVVGKMQDFLMLNLEVYVVTLLLQSVELSLCQRNTRDFSLRNNT